MGVYPGFLSAEGASLPAVPGIDGVAVVEALGDGQDASASAPLTDLHGQPLSVGDRVVSAYGFDVANGQGSWQEYVDLPAHHLSKVPPSSAESAAPKISLLAASAFFVNPVTVVGLLEASAVPEGGWLIVTSALSGLSKMLLAVAKHRGVRTLGIVRRSDAVEEAIRCGATAAVCWNEDNPCDLARKMKEVTGDGSLAHAAVDSVGGGLTAAVCDAVKDGGTVFVYGAQSGLTASASIPALLFRDVRLRGFWLSPWLESLPDGGRARVMKAVWDLYGAGLMQSADADAKKFPLSQFSEAVAESQRLRRGGKVYLVNDGDEEGV
jgi:NADPH:quinone reductase-like Zn-dependent oxidoreductase